MEDCRRMGFRAHSSPAAGAHQRTDYAVVIPPPSKADQFGTAWGSNPIYLRFSDTAAINAARAIRDLKLAWPIAAADRQNTPLFVISGVSVAFL